MLLFSFTSNFLSFLVHSKIQCLRKNHIKMNSFFKMENNMMEINEDRENINFSCDIGSFLMDRLLNLKKDLVACYQMHSFLTQRNQDNTPETNNILSAIEETLSAFTRILVEPRILSGPNFKILIILC